MNSKFNKGSFKKSGFDFIVHSYLTSGEISGVNPWKNSFLKDESCLKFPVGNYFNLDYSNNPVF